MQRLSMAVAVAGLYACALPPDKALPTSPTAEPTSMPPPPQLAVPAARPGPAETPAPAVPVVSLGAAPVVVTVQAEEPRYAPPESLKKFRYAKPPAEKPQPDKSAPPPGRAATGPQPQPVASPLEPVAANLTPPLVATVTATPDEPRYKLPESLAHWNSGRKVPLYADPDAAPWQATPTEPRLQNAAVSCNYKDEGGVRGKAMLLVNNHKLTRFTARIEMPNGGICQFDSKKMEQLPFEQGIALQSRGDECIVRMWEQKHRITIAAYSCHKQCSRGSFSYLWPIIMDTRVGTCY